MSEALLDQMARTSRERLARSLAVRPAEDWRARALEAEAPPTLRLSGFDLIAECKLRAPSAGRLAGGEVGPAQLVDRAKTYASAGAAAISVLTEPHRFDGALEHLEAVAGAVDVPAMRKDFLVDPVQVWEGRVAGAGGVLLITRMLDDATLAAMLDAAAECGMFALVECFDAEDCRRTASAIGGRDGVLVGVNTRDLRTLEVPLRAAGGPGPAPPGGRSLGRGERDGDGRRCRSGWGAGLPGGPRRHGADAGPGSGRAGRRDAGGGERGVRVKICGLRRVLEVEAAVQAGADAIGFVFARSPRQVTPEEARPLVEAVPAGVDVVAVFREPAPELLADVLALGVNAVQADASWRGELPDGVYFLPALKDGPDLHERAAALPVLPTGSGLRGSILIDGPLGGGRGVRADADRVAAVAGNRPVVLAGGLRPDNVHAAIARVRPFGVDVSSGVESAPGVKDPARIHAFFEAVRAAEDG